MRLQFPLWAGPFLRRAGSYAAMVAIILLPAIWNGFPFVYSDTGGYLLRPFTHDFDMGRSAFYGAFLATGIAVDFWSNAIIQALLSAWVITLVLRSVGMERPWIAVGVVGALCVGTSLPWYAGDLEPDVFLPLSILAFYLTAFAPSKLRRWETAALVAVICCSIAFHMSIYAVLLLLFAFCAVLWTVAARLALPRPRLIVPALSLALGAALALASNYLIVGTARFTPGGTIFLFGRLLEDGFVTTYLDRTCPDPSLSLCQYRDALPTQSDDWLWGTETPLAKLGGWRAFTPEANRIIIATVREQPAAQIVAALKDTVRQIGTLATGDGFGSNDNWHTAWVFKQYAPDTVRSFDASAQQRDAIDFHPVNRLHVPLALGATFLLPVLVVFCWRRRAVTTPLGLTVFVALMANAVICATFSVVADRYQSRIVPIAVLAAALAGHELLKELLKFRRGRVIAGRDS